MRQFLCCITLCVLAGGPYAASAQCPASTPLVINPVSTTESRCQASGTATITASGGAAPYFYSITAGPVTVPPQSTNVFQSLAPGNYTLQVTDNCNTSLTTNFLIAGTYTVPLPTAGVQSPTCQGGNDGMMTIHVADGRQPYTFSLISPSPITVASQSVNQFNGLTGGSYTYRVTDSCANYQTRTVALPDGDNAAFYIQMGDLHYEGCDSFSIAYALYPLTSPYLHPPYTMGLTLPNGTIINHVLNVGRIAPFTSSVSDTFYFKYRHTTGSFDYISLTGMNSCGASYSTGTSLIVLDMAAYATPVPGCSRQYAYAFDQGKDNNPLYAYQLKLHCPTVTYTLVSPSGNVLATQINNSSFSGFPPGNGYKIIREDCCRKDSLLFNWAAMPILKISGYTANPGNTCKEGTTSVNINVGPVSTGSIIVASGPPSVVMADGTVHYYTYPDTVRNQPFGTSGVNINYFTAGTYTLYAMDNCGQKDSITFTLSPADMRHSTFSAQAVKGCTGDNKIMLDASSNTGANLYGYDAFISTGPAGYFGSPGDYPYADSITHLSSGTYYVNYMYQSRDYVSYLKGMDGYGCDVIADTLVLPAYTQPLLAPSAAIASCGVLRNIALLPDTSRGLMPFQYQVISGPVTTPLQPDPVFHNLPSGTYGFLLADACGNSYTTNISIDTLVVPRAVAAGNTCQSGAAVLLLPSSPFYSYTWQRPDGATSSGDRIMLNPITPADTGTYTIQVTSNVGGCTDSKSSTITLDYCSLILLPVSQLNFTGARQADHIKLTWQAMDETSVANYTVERSADGAHFTTLERLSATGLTTNTFTVIDHRPLPGISYYRLQMGLTDGSARYSRILSFSGKAALKPEVYPTLITGNTPLLATWPATTQNAFIQLMGMDGRIWLTLPIEKGASQTSIDTSHLPRGSYLVVFTQSGQKTAVRVLKE